MRHAITTRLVMLFAVAALATFALTGAALYGVLQHELARHERDELNTYLHNLQYSIERTGTLERWARVQIKMDTLTADDGSVRFWVLSDDPRFQYGKGLAEVEHMNREPDGLGSILMPAPQHPLRTLSASLPALDDRPAVRLIIGIDSAPYVQTLNTFLTALAVLSLTTVLLLMLIGYWIARVGLRPLVRLSKQAQALRPKAHAQRLNVAALPVELSDLANAFNGALSRQQEAYRQLETFNADVAHELRTPLANLIGGTQVALSRQRTAPEFQEALQSNLEELERVRSIINDMLFLARADQGEAATGLVRTPIAQEVRKTAEFFEFVLDELGATVRIEGDVAAEAMIETALFRRAMSNLLQNAIEHSGPGAQLSVHIRQEASQVWVTVSNPGEPIADAHLPRLFDRFYRVDAARQAQGEHHGHGLGLAIVKAVASMHGGSVVAACAAGVTSIGFSLPSPGGLTNPVAAQPTLS
jgi:two-component system heavy metal sensor histidine kinase CusS